MKKRSKNISVALVFFPAVFFAFSAFGSETNITTFATTPEIEQHAEFDAIININSEIGLMGADFYLNFDPNFLEYRGSIDGGFFSQEECPALITEAPVEGTLGQHAFSVITCDFMTPKTGDQNLIILHFKSLNQAGQTKISFSNNDLTDEAWMPLGITDWDEIEITIKESDESIIDTESPSVSISYPTTAPNHDYSSSSNSIDISGSALDNVGVAVVSWVSNQGLSGAANGTSTWEVANIPLSVGTNILTVTAKDAAGNSSSTQISINYSIPLADFPIISEINASTGTSSALISWQTNEPTDSQIFYGLTNEYYQTTLLDPATTTNHSILLTGLAPNTTYYYQILSRDIDGNLATSSDQIFQTLVDPQIPFIFTNPSLIQVASGTIFSVALVASSTENLTSVYSDINFDQTIIEYVEIEKGPFLIQNSSISLLSSLISPGKVGFGISQIAGLGVTGQEKAVIIYFRAIASGQTDISFSSYGLAIYKNEVTELLNGQGWAAVPVAVSDLAQADIKTPSISITKPSSSGYYDYSSQNSTINIGGFAQDNIALASINWSSNKGAFGAASGKSVWSASVSLSPGENIITATAVDSNNNSSSTQITINFTPKNSGGSGGGSGGGSDGSGQILTIHEQNIALTEINQASMKISWMTNYKSSSRVIYSKENQPHAFYADDKTPGLSLFGYASTTAEFDLPVSINGVLLHAVELTNLEPNTTYYYRCVSAASPPTFSQEHSFTTAKITTVQNEPNNLVLNNNIILSQKTPEPTPVQTIKQEAKQAEATINENLETPRPSVNEAAKAAKNFLETEKKSSPEKKSVPSDIPAETGNKPVDQAKNLTANIASGIWQKTRFLAIVAAIAIIIFYFLFRKRKGRNQG